MSTEKNQSPSRGTEIVQFLIDLFEESERSVIITGVAKIESLIDELLFNYLRGRKSFKDKLFDFNGPLGTLSSKIKIAYALKLIDKELYQTLEKLRDLRNDFAHKLEAKTLSTSNYKDKLNSKFDKSIDLIAFSHDSLIKFNAVRKKKEKINPETLKFLSILSAIMIVLESGNKFYEKKQISIEATLTF